MFPFQTEEYLSKKNKNREVKLSLKLLKILIETTKEPNMVLNIRRRI